VSTARKSAVNSYRLVGGLWIGLSLVYTAEYWHLAVLSGRLLQGCLLASAFLIQALLVPAYIWRERFSSCAEAAIQSASAAVSVVGIPAIFLVLTKSTLWSSEFERHYYNFAFVATGGLQFGYVATILVLSGLAGGTALGILRWRILQAEAEQANFSPDSNPNSEPSRSWWERYLRSAMPWAATVAIYSWAIDALIWSGSLPAWGMSYPSRNDNLLAEVLLGIGGLLFVAPMPLRSRVPEAGSRGTRLWNILKLPLRLIAIFSGVIAVPWFIYAVGVFVMHCIVLGVPCLSWAILYERSLPPPREGAPLSEKELTSVHPVPLRPKPGGIWNGMVVLITAASQACAVFAGMLATAPASLGTDGIGCLTVENVGGRAYWFWKAYKGLRSEVRSEKRIIVRPSVDASACMVLNERAMAQIDDPQEIGKGYAGAARIWAWLIDPEQWDGERTKQIRKELTRLLGRDFSSYAELEAWWTSNGENLAWAGTDELLEIREPEHPVDSEPSDNYLREPYVHLPFPSKYYVAPEFFGHEPPLPFTFGGSFSPMVRKSSWPQFPLYGDPEARLRALKLDAAGCIEIVTGQQQRRVQEYLHKVIGGDYSSYTEWRNFFARSPRQNPWTVRRREVAALIDLLQRSRNSPGTEESEVRNLQVKTGLSYSSLDDFIEWLQNPDNTRFEEWENAATVFVVYDAPELSTHQNALAWLKMITGKNFDSPEEWVQWWHANRSNVVLSPDGLKLVKIK